MKKTYSSLFLTIFYRKTGLLKNISKPKKTLRNLLLILFIGFSILQNFAQGISCLTASSLIINAAPVSGLINNTTINDPSATSCITGNIIQDGWYSFVASETTATVTVVSNNRQLVIYAYSGNCFGLTQIDCANTNTIAGTQTEIMSLTGLINGDTYFIRVGNSGAGASMTINAINVSTFTNPINDDCSGSIPLTVSSTCTYTTFTNTNATATLGVPTPTCASYSGGDVWFSVIVPSNGILTIDTQIGIVLDSGMEIYSGTCGALTLIECDDDDSINGTMSSINRNDLTPGSTIYIRVWEFGNNNNGTFGICVTSPTCISPSLNEATNIALNSATISWSLPISIPSNGYQYIVSTTNTTPIIAGTSTLSTIINLTGLASNSIYYVFVRSDCSSGDFSPWTSSITFSTGYCNTSSTSSAFFVSNFLTTGGTLNITNNNSGYSATGFGNFISKIVSQVNYGIVNFTADFSGTFDTFGFNIWVDWNDDFDFNDLNEKVYASGAYVTNASGSFSVPASAIVGNHRMRIRADYNNTNPSSCGSITSGETEDYTFTVLPPPPCSGNPTNVLANLTSITTTTINWTAAIPLPANGYEYFLTTTNTSPSSASGTVSAGVTTLNLTGLTAGLTYYFWIRSNCGGGLGQGTWISPVNFTQPLCSIGNGIGTTTLGCPSVLSGGLGLSGSNPSPKDCIASTCVDLEATYLSLGETSSYMVEPIAFNPPYQFDCLENPVSVNIDDKWSPVINLPFNFCFYGNSYNKCLIGSNGVISFDITSNTPEGFSTYSFNTNLPNTNLFLNTIFGVYQDIDPSLGGKIGWELITLNTGCRALVASWSNVPMYEDVFGVEPCNSLLYTGMIVLYENTNIIEVYVKQKQVCSEWNNGNGLIGIQNANGTIASVPPNRNSLSTNWSATNEAWRFIPSGTSITTIKWYEGSGTSGTVLGTSDTLTVCPGATTNYTAEVTYSLCGGAILKELDETTVTVTGTKTWNGSIDNNWNTANNWTPIGVPNASSCVVIPNVSVDPIILGSSYNGFGNNLTVLNGGVLQNNPSNSLTITNFVNVNTGGQFLLKDSSNLIQINNVANFGNINMERITQPIYRFDYTFWGSPLTLASNYTLGNLSPNTQSDKYYSWTPTIGGNFGNWNQESTATIMDPRKGYIVRAPNSFSYTPNIKVPYTANFIGTPNNGDVLCPVIYGSLGVATNNDKYNLLGNPYPCAISASAFLNDPNNANVIDGTIYFWTHNSPPSTSFPDPFYGDFVVNYTATDYATWNKLGGVGTTAGTGGTTPNGFIAAGESFFTRSLANIPGGQAVFKNTMRVSGNNNQFFRTSNPSESININENEFEKHRLWLNIIDSNGGFNQILLGYAQGATNDWDRGFDGIRFDINALNLYTIIPNNILAIQGKSLPFNISDKVFLGYKSVIEGSYSIRIDHFDGLFENQNIYIEDKLLNIIHDLKESPYLFSSGVGTFNDRFLLRYNQETLNTTNSNSILYAYAHIKEQKIEIQASENIHSVQVFDLTGKLVLSENLEKISTAFSTNWNFATGIYIAKIKLENNVIISQKIEN